MPLTQGTWRPYDPTWLVRFALEALPDQPWFAKALEDCTMCLINSPHYIYFVSDWHANRPESPWQFVDNLILEHPTEGELAFDILEHGVIGGVEFLEREEMASLPGVDGPLSAEGF